MHAKKGPSLPSLGIWSSDLIAMTTFYRTPRHTTSGRLTEGSVQSECVPKSMSWHEFQVFRVKDYVLELSVYS